MVQPLYPGSWSNLSDLFSITPFGDPLTENVAAHRTLYVGFTKKRNETDLVSSAQKLGLIYALVHENIRKWVFLTETENEENNSSLGSNRKQQWSQVRKFRSK